MTTPDYRTGPACPDCGSAATTIYPMEEGAATLYCDSCKREEPLRGFANPDYSDPLDRKPDTVTFTTSEEKVYAVTGSHLKMDHDVQTLKRIDLFAEGEFVESYGPEDEVPKGDRDIITAAAAIAGVSVASLSEYLP